MVESIQQVAGKITTTPDGLYDQKVTLTTGSVSISNKNLDLEFDIPFDDDTEANEAEFVIYNLADATVNAIKKGAAISATAGYGKDVGVIFSGYISYKKTYWEDNDRVTVIKAIDYNGKKETELENVSYASGTKASTILRKLVEKLGLSIAVFQTKRDYTYKDKVTISGGLSQNIKEYAQICGVVAYVCKSSVYVCPLSYVGSTTFSLTADTGLLSANEFEEEVKAEDYTDTITGQEIEMLLQHRITTGSRINLTSKNAKGEYRVSSGRHTYDGNEFITTVKAIAASCIKK